MKVFLRLLARNKAKSLIKIILNRALLKVILGKHEEKFRKISNQQKVLAPFCLHRDGD